MSPASTPAGQPRGQVVPREMTYRVIVLCTSPCPLSPPVIPAAFIPTSKASAFSPLSPRGPSLKGRSNKIRKYYLFYPTPCLRSHISMSKTEQFCSKKQKQRKHPKICLSSRLTFIEHLLCGKHDSKYFTYIDLLKFPWPPSEVGIIIFPFYKQGN